MTRESVIARAEGVAISIEGMIVDIAMQASGFSGYSSLGEN